MRVWVGQGGAIAERTQQPRETNPSGARTNSPDAPNEPERPPDGKGQAGRRRFETNPSGVPKRTPLGANELRGRANELAAARNEPEAVSECENEANRIVGSSGLMDS